MEIQETVQYENIPYISHYKHDLIMEADNEIDKLINEIRTDDLIETIAEAITIHIGNENLNLDEFLNI